MCKSLLEYKKIAGDFAAEQFLFYSGNTLSAPWQGIHIYSYRDLASAFSVLE